MVLTPSIVESCIVDFHCCLVSRKLCFHENLFESFISTMVDCYSFSPTDWMETLCQLLHNF